jgi:hypothetical protein
MKLVMLQVSFEVMSGCLSNVLDFNEHICIRMFAKNARSIDSVGQ